MSARVSEARRAPRRQLAHRLIFVALLTPSSALAAQVVVVSTNAAGAGFNDPAPFTPVGGNVATTRGAARLAALQFAADSWGRELTSAVTIEVAASFDPLTCSASGALLGAAGAMTVHHDFPGAPRPNVWYAQALANSLAGVDLAPADRDISATFSSTLDEGTCLGAQTWYYGLDGQAPTGTVDFVTVALHELAHGLGFSTFVALSTGIKLFGLDDAFMLRLEQRGASPAAFADMTDAQRVQASESDPLLVWTGAALDGAAAAILTAGMNGGEVRLYAPATQRPGSSLNHFSTALTPNDLMEPFHTGTNHDLRLTTQLLRDTGWRLPTATVPALPVSARVCLIAVLALAGGAARARRRLQRTVMAAVGRAGAPSSAGSA